MRTNKERTPSQISREARPSALLEIWKRRVKWGHTVSPIHFTQPSTQLLTVKVGRIPSKPDTQLRISPCFGSQTQPACPFPNPRIFPMRGNQLHPPQYHRSTSPRLSPQERQNYITPPRPASIAAPARTGTRCRTLRAKMQIPHRVCKHDAEFRQISLAFIRRKIS